jgi:hypothetical protein
MADQTQTAQATSATDNEYRFEFSAKVFFNHYDPITHKSIIHPPSHFRTVMDRKTYGLMVDMIRKLNLPTDILLLLESFDIISISTCYHKDSIYMTARIRSERSHQQIKQELESCVVCYYDPAFDTFLESGAVENDTNSSMNANSSGSGSNSNGSGSNSNSDEENKNSDSESKNVMKYELVFDEIEVSIYDKDMFEEICGIKPRKHWCRSP